MTGNASTSDGDVVAATRQLVTTVDAAGERVGADLPVLEREVSGPTECLDGDGFQGSIAWTQVLAEDADADEVLATVASRTVSTPTGSRSPRTCRGRSPTRSPSCAAPTADAAASATTVDALVSRVRRR